MRVLIAALCALLCVPAFAAYDVTATMPSVSGGGKPTGCQLYLNGAAVAGGAKTCDSPVVFPALLAADGTYSFAYSEINAAGETVKSPIRTVTITTTSLPSPPTQPPSISVTCSPSPCPPSITITIAP